MKSKVSLRYAKALFLMGGSGAEQEQRVKQLKNASDFLLVHPEIAPVLSSPQILKEEKESLLQKILGGILDKPLMNFLDLLLEKGRLKYLAEIVKNYHEIVNEHFGIRLVKLITATPIDPKEKEILKAKLEKFYQKTVEISAEIDTDIIGGAVLIVGNMMLDCSIRERMAKLKDDLLAVTF